MDCSLLGSSVHGVLQARILEWKEGRKYIFLPQGIFLTQGLNPGLLHWKQILYHLIYQGSPIINAAAATAKSLQSCPTLCNPIDGSLPVSHVPGILQARTLEWAATSFSNARK